MPALAELCGKEEEIAHKCRKEEAERERERERAHMWNHLNDWLKETNVMLR